MTVTVTKKSGTSESFSNVNSININQSSDVVISLMQTVSEEKHNITQLNSTNFADIEITIQARDISNV